LCPVNFDCHMHLILLGVFKNYPPFAIINKLD
jgi:hypothetical protein